MKRLALLAAVLAVAACSTENKTSVTDTATPALAPAPSAMDSAMMDSMRMDTTDTTGRDTTSN